MSVQRDDDVFVRRVSSTRPGARAHDGRRRRGVASGARRSFAVTAAALAVVTAASIAAVGAVGTRSTGVRTSAALVGPRKLLPPFVPPNGSYLGIDANYNNNSTEIQVLNFEHSVGSPVGLASFYVGFLQIPIMSQMHAVLSAGAVPMVNMKCGATDVSVAAGQWDRQLQKLALTLKSFGGPVFFRWFWEMNLTKTGEHTLCLGNKGAAGYIAAYRHIWNIFYKAGARNVAFVWAPSDADHVPDSDTLTYYPGGQYVDWIGADLYDRQNIHKTFGHEFDAFYRFWHTEAPTKPIMLSETGAVGAEQVSWLKQIYACLTRKVYMTRDTPYTQVKAIIYVDAIDKYNYILAPDTVGHQEYSFMIHHKYFDVFATS